MTKFQLIADAETCNLYVAAECGTAAAIKTTLTPAAGTRAMFVVPCATMFVKRGTKTECQNFRVRVAEMAAHQRGRLGKPLAGNIQIVSL